MRCERKSRRAEEQTADCGSTRLHWAPACQFQSSAANDSTCLSVVPVVDPAGLAVAPGEH